MTQALNRHPARRCHHAANCVIGVRLNRKMHFHCRLSLRCSVNTELNFAEDMHAGVGRRFKACVMRSPAPACVA